MMAICLPLVQALWTLSITTITLVICPLDQAPYVEWACREQTPSWLQQLDKTDSVSVSELHLLYTLKSVATKKPKQPSGCLPAFWVECNLSQQLDGFWF